MKIGEIGGLGPAWVDGDDHNFFRIAVLSLFDSLEEHRVAIGCVGADKKKTIGLVDVGIRGWRTIAAERRLIPGHRRRHTKA